MSLPEEKGRECCLCLEGVVVREDVSGIVAVGGGGCRGGDMLLMFL